MLLGHESGKALLIGKEEMEEETPERSRTEGLVDTQPSVVFLSGRDVSLMHPETSPFMRGDSPHFMVNQFPHNKARSDE